MVHTGKVVTLQPSKTHLTCFKNASYFYRQKVHVYTFEQPTMYNMYVYAHLLSMKGETFFFLHYLTFLLSFFIF